jgi:hypothetical protein
MKIPGDAICAVAFAFERAHGHLLGEYEESQISFHGLDGHEPIVLAAALRDGILAGDTNYRTQAYWALGKRFDRELIPFFRERLAAEMLDDPSIVYQIMIALDNLGEPVFSKARSGSYSILDADLNLVDAEIYLGKVKEQS